MVIFLLIIYALITIFTLIHLILFGSRPSKSFSWLLAVIMLPFLGVLLYVLFGINRRKLKFLRLKQTHQMKRYDHLHLKSSPNKLDIESLPERHQKIAKLVTNSTKFYPSGGNHVRILDDGLKTFEAIFEALEKAQNFIHIQFYIFEEGILLDRLFLLFKQKIEEGVEVRIIYDAIGSFRFGKKQIYRFQNIGATVCSTMPLRFGSILFTINYRNHRKIIVIDGTVGFTGGVNISDKYIKPSSIGIWDDMHLRLDGPIVDQLHQVFVKDYFFASKGEDLFNEKYLPRILPKGNAALQIVASGPDSDFASIMQQYIILINKAKYQICIANPYFIPSVSVLEALKIAALSGVVIKLLIPEKSDNLLIRYSVLSYFEELLAVGVNIYMNTFKFLHSKMILIDKEIASVGSGNFDNRSFDQNFEANVLIYDTPTVKLLQKDFDLDCSQSKCISLSEFKNRPLKNKIFEGIARIFSPLL